MEILPTKRGFTKEKDAERNRERSRNNKRRRIFCKSASHKDKREKGKENTFVCPYQWRAERKITKSKHIICHLMNYMIIY